MNVKDKGIFGFAIYTLLLAGFVIMLLPANFASGSHRFIIVVGSLALWRYSWGLIHYARHFIYRYWVFPRMRAHVENSENEFMPPHMYFLITSFRIDTQTTLAVFKSVISEAMACGIASTIVASIVEKGDEAAIRLLFEHSSPQPGIALKIVRIPGSGKRDGLAQGFRAISRDMPHPDAVVAVIDGDTVLENGLTRKCVPFFRLQPHLGALTTDEVCEVKGSALIRNWHDLRFTQRQILMSSLALSRKVLTLTGRMSMFRASIIIDPDFIRQVEDDFIDHWRLGRFKFLTGDDKSTWYWVLKEGWDMLYIPDAVVSTVEHPPAGSFVQATTQLMFRWFGNMLRTNGRALKIGPFRAGWFPWWCVVDQRISMWTSLIGPVFAAFLAIRQGFVFFLIYLTWIGFTRWVMSMMMLAARERVSWMYPFLIYYNQVWGSLVKIYVFFRLDKQSWTRQKTKLDRGLSSFQTDMQAVTSTLSFTVSLLVFICAVGFVSGALN